MKLARQQYRKLPLADLQPHPRNPRRGDLAAISESLERNDFYGTIVVQKSTGYVLAGNHRLLAAREAGATDLPAMVIDCDDETALRILLADNGTSDRAEYDDPELHALLKEVGAVSGTLEGTGFGLDDFRVLERELARLEPDTPSDADDDAPEPPTEPRSVAGEIYELGPHRLLCGDATKPEDVRAVAEGELAEVMWTDPPYGIGYVGSGRAEAEGTTRRPIAGDEARGGALREFLASAFAAADLVLAESARFYITSSPGPSGTEARLALREVGWRHHVTLAWVKQTMVIGHSDYHGQHEDVLYGWKPGPGRAGRGNHEGSRWYGGNDQTSVFAVDRPTRSESHPTMKPVDLIAAQLRNSSRAGDAVLDPFAGSGSTLIACERLGRRCLAVELDPAYCDVIRDRYEAFVASRAAA